MERGLDDFVAQLLVALIKRDALTCTQLFVPDGLLLSPYSSEARGSRAIAAVHQTWFDEGERNKVLTVLDSRIDGNLGFCLLAYSGEYPQANGTFLVEKGKSVNVLVRQPDTSWRILVSSLNRD